MEWIVDCERVSAVENNEVTTGRTCLVPGRVACIPPELLKPLLFGLLGLTERSRVSISEIVLVQGFLDEVQVKIFERLIPIFHEFGLWAGHCDKAHGEVLSGGRAKSDLYILANYARSTVR